MQNIDRFLEADVPLKDGSVLSESYIPPTILHREEQMQSIGSRLGLLLKGLKPPHMRIFGPAGTGKTLIIRSFFKRLEEKIDRSKTYLIYTVCGKSSLKTLQAISKLTPGGPLPKRGFSLDESWESYKDLIAGKRVVVALDEADRLIKWETNPWLLYDLANEDNISVILIYNQPEDEPDVFETIDDKRITSRLVGTVVRFPPYNAAQLVDILKQRVKLGFKEGTVESGAISLCAALTVRDEGGNARHALEVLDEAWKIAVERGEMTITEEHIKQAHRLLKEERLYRPIGTLEPREVAVLLAVASGQAVKSSIDAFVEPYRVSPRQVQDILPRLCRLGFLVGTRKGVGRGKGTTFVYSLSSQYVPEKVVKVCQEVLKR